MIEMYKICYGLYDRNATAGLFERNDRDSRGNACKIVVCKANLEMRKIFFTIRAPLDWNNLPQETVQSKTIDEFKWKLDEHWKAIGIDIVPFCQMAQRNLPTKHESERKGLNSKKVLERRIEVF